MRKWIVHSVVFLLLVSCGEELIPKPDNLISTDKMADIIQEMAILNSAKTTNAAILSKNNIEPTQYILEKFKVDSLQYVESDQYYVSKPVVYEKIYKIVEERLDAVANEMSEAKKKQDSIRLKEKSDKTEIRERGKNKVKSDSLP